jgi:hypothetical protein
MPWNAIGMPWNLIGIPCHLIRIPTTPDCLCRNLNPHPWNTNRTSYNANRIPGNLNRIPSRPNGHPMNSNGSYQGPKSAHFSLKLVWRADRHVRRLRKVDAASRRVPFSVYRLLLSIPPQQAAASITHLGCARERSWPGVREEGCSAKATEVEAGQRPFSLPS